MSLPKTNEELLTDYKNLVDEIGRTPTYKDLEERHLTNIVRRIGPLNEINKLFGLPITHRSPAVITETDEDLIRLYKEFSKREGYKNGAPVKKIDESPDIYSSTVFLARFGGINELRIRSGYEPQNYGAVADHTPEELAADILAFCEKYRRLPKFNEFRIKNGLCSIATYRRFLKVMSVSDIYRKSAEVCPALSKYLIPEYGYHIHSQNTHRIFTKEEIAESILQFAKTKGRLPTYREFRGDNGLNSKMTVRARFNANTLEEVFERASEYSPEIKNYMKSK